MDLLAADDRTIDKSEQSADELDLDHLPNSVKSLLRSLDSTQDREYLAMRNVSIAVCVLFLVLLHLSFKLPFLVHPYIPASPKDSWLDVIHRQISVFFFAPRPRKSHVSAPMYWFSLSRINQFTVASMKDSKMISQMDALCFMFVVFFAGLLLLNRITSVSGQPTRIGNRGEMLRKGLVHLVSAVNLIAFMAYFLQWIHLVPMHSTSLNHPIVTIRYVEWFCSNMALNFMQCSMGKWSIQQRVATMVLSGIMIFSGFLSFYLWAPANMIAMAISFGSCALVLRRIRTALIDAENSCLHPHDAAQIMKLRRYTMILWWCFPVVCIVGEYISTSPLPVELCVCCLDTVAKAIYSLLLYRGSRLTFRRLEALQLMSIISPTDDIHEKTIVRDQILSLQTAINNIYLPLKQKFKVQNRPIATDESPVPPQSEIDESVATHYLSDFELRFLQRIHQDFRNPLERVIGNSLGILRSIPVDSKLRDHLEISLASGQSLLMSVENLLTLSEASRNKGTIRINPGHCNLYSLMDQLVDFAQQTAPNKLNRLEFILSFNPIGFSREFSPVLLADSAKVLLVARNLIDNALRFSQVGHVLVQINIQNSPPSASGKSSSSAGISQDFFVSDEVLFQMSIQDTGRSDSLGQKHSNESITPSANEDNHDHDNYDLYRANQGAGFGIGLQVVRALVQNMRGKLFVTFGVGGSPGSSAWSMQLPATSAAATFSTSSGALGTNATFQIPVRRLDEVPENSKSMISSHTLFLEVPGLHTHSLPDTFIRSKSLASVSDVAHGEFDAGSVSVIDQSGKPAASRRPMKIALLIEHDALQSSISSFLKCMGAEIIQISFRSIDFVQLEKCDVIIIDSELLYHNGDLKSFVFSQSFIFRSQNSCLIELLPIYSNESSMLVPDRCEDLSDSSHLFSSHLDLEIQVTRHHCRLRRPIHMTNLLKEMLEFVEACAKNNALSSISVAEA